MQITNFKHNCKRIGMLTAFLMLFYMGASAQTETKKDSTALQKMWNDAKMFSDKYHFKASGSIQSNWLIPQEDEKIGTGEVTDKVLTNTYADVNVTSDHVDAGLRLEYLKHPLPGFENDFKGWGLPYYYARIHYNKWDVTLGSFYEQFGSGFILRTYEERSLGIDNQLRGVRATVKPLKGVQFKILSGKQRHYWESNDSWVTGADLEVNLEDYLQVLQQRDMFLTVGASWVHKHEKDELIMHDPSYRYNFPTHINAFDLRANLHKGGFNILAEGAFKGQDPNFDNGFIYKHGHVEMLSASYSEKGLSLLLQAKRSDNMSFRSRRNITGTSSYINHLPAFTMEHTYTLAALYPYATQPDGEWAYQAQGAYTFKKGTLLGGKYGTKVNVNFSYVRGLDKTEKEGTSGYSSKFFGWGTVNYQDVNVQIEKKFSKAFKLNAMYMNQIYNKTVIEGEGGIIYSNIFVLDGKYKINKKFTLRCELQYLTTAQDQHDWAFGLVELSMAPNWMFTVSDEWNCGTTGIHYYNASVTYNHGSHRLQVGYGKTRAGFNCSGGVCRYVPASKGFSVSYNFNF